jgi:hypothetical protein
VFKSSLDRVTPRRIFTHQAKRWTRMGQERRKKEGFNRKALSMQGNEGFCRYVKGNEGFCRYVKGNEGFCRYVKGNEGFSARAAKGFSARRSI